MTNATSTGRFPHVSILLREYTLGVEATDLFGKSEIHPMLLGLFGEVGSVMSAVKKHKREGAAFESYRQAVEEELGDVLWYFTALCKRIGVTVETVLNDVSKNGKYKTAIAASDLPDWPLSEVSTVATMPHLDEVLFGLGRTAAALLAVSPSDESARGKLADFADYYLHVLQASDVSFAEVIQSNLAKVRGRFLPPDRARLPTFDSAFPDEEQIPREFEIVIKQRKNGQSCL